MAKVTWRKSLRQAYGPGVDRYESKVRQVIVMQCQYWAAVAEQRAKEDAPWTDRTSNARQTLRGWVDEQDKIIRLVLQHGVPYGKWLEVISGGIWAIVTPTIEEMADEVFRSIVDLLR